MWFVLALAAQAAEPVLDTSLGASYWPEGLKLSAKPGVKMPLWNKEDSILFGDTFVTTRAIVDVTPSYARVGPEVVFSPIAVFELSAHAVVSPYFGTFSSIKPLQSAEAVPDDATLDPLEAQTGFVVRYGAEATLQAKVGPVIAAAWGGPQFWHTRSPAEVDGGYFYEPETELVLAWNDRTWTVNGVALAEIVLVPGTEKKLLIGDYTDAHGSLVTDDQILRNGLMAVYRHDSHLSVLLLTLVHLGERVYDEPFPPYVATQVRWSPSLSR